MGCKFYAYETVWNEKHLADGAKIWCEWEKQNKPNLCKLCNDGHNVWGSEFQAEDDETEILSGNIKNENN
jgi:hypothetical protein